MDLSQVTKELVSIAKKLTKLIPEMERVDLEYQEESAKWLLASMESTQGKREAEVTLRLKESGLAEKRLNMKYEIRVLLTQKEIYLELSKNFRMLEGRV